MKTTVSRKSICIGIHRLYYRLSKTATDLDKLITALLFIISVVGGVIGLKNVVHNLDFGLVEKIGAGYCILNIIILIIVWGIREYLIKEKTPFTRHLEDCFLFENGILKFKSSFNEYKSVDPIFRKGTKKDKKHIFKLHKNEFKNTSWQEEKTTVIKRALANIDRNDQSFNLIEQVQQTGHTNSKDIIGFTHIVPLNINNWIKFRAGEIKDINILKENITPDSATIKATVPRDVKPFGLLIISLISKTEPISEKEKNGKLLIKALAYHLSLYCLREFVGQDIIPIMFQSLRPEVSEKFKDFRTKTISRDYGEIFCIELLNKENYKKNEEEEEEDNEDASEQNQDAVNTNIPEKNVVGKNITAKNMDDTNLAPIIITTAGILCLISLLFSKC